MSTEAPARVCVVVSCYDRAELLGALVAALRAQTVDDFEVVVVDNGSADDTRSVLHRLADGDPRFRVLHLDENRGPARARNLAWRSTEAALIAFTDDDCAPEPDWLAALVDAASDAQIVQGRTLPAPRDPGQRVGWFDRTQRIEEWSGRFETCNLLVAREVLAGHDGFDERFPIAMGEDTDFGLRAVTAGASATFAADAVVRHHVFPSRVVDYLRQRRRYAESVQLMRLNPAARQLLRFGCVLRGVHLLVWGVVVATPVSIVAGAPWLPLVAVGTWVALNTYRTRFRPFPLLSRVGYSVVHLAAFAYETFWFAVASVRHRVLVI